MLLKKPWTFGNATLLRVSPVSNPMHLWCRLIQQATMTLNLLRPARINSRLAAEAHLNGTFDYNRTSLAPPGTNVLVHKTSGNRRTWDPHGVDGWYIGAISEHFVATTKTVKLFPHNCAMPNTSSARCSHASSCSGSHTCTRESFSCCPSCHHRNRTATCYQPISRYFPNQHFASTQ